MELTIYHNPKCSKSQQTLALIEKSFVKYRVVEYLKESIPLEVLKLAYRELGMKIVRIKDDEFQSYKDRKLSESEVLELLIRLPRLIQRPIVINQDCIIIARPPTKILEIL